MSLTFVALAASLFPLGYAAQQPYDVKKIIEAFRQPKDDLNIICAHRGLRWNGTADNSWDAYYRASQAGLECIETDIRLSSDGVLTMIHDAGLGRETNIGELSNQSAYNPYTGQGYNPLVVETPYRGVIENLRVRDETGRVHAEKVPTLPEMVQDIHDAGTNVVLQLDVKDPAAVEYMYYQLKPLTNAAGVPANEWCIYKLQADWYSTPEDFETAAWVQDAFASGVQLAYIPVYSDRHAEEGDVVEAVKAWAQTNYTISVEVNMKSNSSKLNGIKEWMRNNASEGASFRTSGVFYAAGDLVDPITSPLTFYDTANYSLPDDIRTNNSVFTFSDDRAPQLLDSNVTPDESSDGHDYRSDLGWIFENSYDWVIADVPDVIAAQLEKEGKRNLEHLIADGEEVVEGQKAKGWYRRGDEKMGRRRGNRDTTRIDRVYSEATASSSLLDGRQTFIP